MRFDPSSRSVLAPCDLPRFPEPTLFARIARTVCAAACLPRKELYESWEVARRVRRRFRGGRVVDLACGHGLTAWIMMILDQSSPAALGIDAALPESAVPLHRALSEVWPALAARVTLASGDLARTELHASDVVVSTHACGALTDLVLARAASAGARVAVLPCCHDTQRCASGGLTGWLDPALAIDVTRAATLRAAGYEVHTQHIPEAITPKNRLLLGWSTSSAE
ncbi:MAG: methyltransferase [Polyangiales bacterium]